MGPIAIRCKSFVARSGNCSKCGKSCRKALGCSKESRCFICAAGGKRETKHQAGSMPLWMQWSWPNIDLMQINHCRATQDEIVVLCHVILRGSRFRGTWAWVFKNWRATSKEKSHRTQHPSALWFRWAISFRKTRIGSQTDIALPPFF